MEDTRNTRTGRKQQLPYILTPLFLLIICLATLNLAPALTTTIGAAPSVQTPTVALATSITPDSGAASAFSDSKEEVAEAPSLLPTSTPYVTLTIAPEREIQLLGPPPGSAFRVGDPLSFYWEWPLPLQEDQSLAAYLLTKNQELLVGRLAEPNVGTRYGLQVTTSDFADVTGAVRWQVRLESIYTQQWLVASEIRPLTLQAAFELIP